MSLGFGEALSKVLGAIPREPPVASNATLPRPAATGPASTVDSKPVGAGGRQRVGNPTLPASSSPHVSFLGEMSTPVDQRLPSNRPAASAIDQPRLSSSTTDSAAGVYLGGEDDDEEFLHPVEGLDGGSSSLSFLASPAAVAGDTLPLSCNTFTCSKCLLRRQSGSHCSRCREPLPKYRTCLRCHSTARGYYCNACGATELEAGQSIPGPSVASGVASPTATGVSGEAAADSSQSSRDQVPAAGTSWSEVEAEWARLAQTRRGREQPTRGGPADPDPLRLGSSVELSSYRATSVDEPGPGGTLALASNSGSSVFPPIASQSGSLVHLHPQSQGFSNRGSHLSVASQGSRRM